jgi:Amt family ammonium transporter
MLFLSKRLAWLVLLAFFIASGSSPAQEKKEDGKAKSAETKAATSEAPRPSQGPGGAGPAPLGDTSPSTASTPAFTPDKADTAWMMICSALVLLMTLPGLALFYGGLVRTKNVLSVMMQCLAMVGLISIQWFICGYSLAFHQGTPQGWFFGNEFWGGFDWLCLKDVNFDDKDPYGYAGTIPHQLFMVYQMMFAIITPALICGAFAERMKFGTMALFLVLWSTFVYDPLAHWVWGQGGFLKNSTESWAKFPALDFAGGTVVHISSGVTALVCAFFLGKRRGYPQEPMLPHSLTFSVIGAGLLWVGWFGFNAGSAVTSNGQAVNAFVATHLATAAAGCSWAVMEWLTRGKASALGAISGAVAGLVAITPACGFVTIQSALVIGLIAGPVCYFACSAVKRAFGYDDSLDAFGIHGVGGTLGAILTGVFAVKNVGAADGLLAGNTTQFMNQLKAVGITWVYAIAASVVLLTILKFTVGLRVSEKDEIEGLDLTQHGERGYHY